MACPSWLITISLYIHSFWSQANLHRVCCIVAKGDAIAVWVTDSRRTSFPTDKCTGLQNREQFATCLLCLLIVEVSLDGVPDPPAVRPEGNPSNLVPHLHSRVPLAASNHVWDYPASALHFQAGLFSFAQILEGKGPSYDPIFVRQATDSSSSLFFLKELCQTDKGLEGSMIPLNVDRCSLSSSRKPYN